MTCAGPMAIPVATPMPSKLCSPEGSLLTARRVAITRSPVFQALSIFLELAGHQRGDRLDRRGRIGSAGNQLDLAALAGGQHH